MESALDRLYPDRSDPERPLMQEQKQDFWFRTIGGWFSIPATWQGWLLIVTYIGLMGFGFTHDVPPYYVIGLIAALMAIRHYWGERPSR